MEQQSMGVHGYMRIFGEVGKKQNKKKSRPSPGEPDRINEKKWMQEWPMKRELEELRPRLRQSLRSEGQ